MSDTEDEKPVIEVTEDAWEEDTQIPAVEPASIATMAALHFARGAPFDSPGSDPPTSDVESSVPGSSEVEGATGATLSSNQGPEIEEATETTLSSNQGPEIEEATETTLSSNFATDETPSATLPPADAPPSEERYAADEGRGESTGFEAPEPQIPRDALLPSEAIDSSVPTPVDRRSFGSDEPPIDEQLSESLPPLASTVPTLRPAEGPIVEAPPVPVSEPPPPSDATGFSHPAVTQPSLSIGEQLLVARRRGTAIWYAGVVLWAYTIVGEWVVGAELPEFFGWSAFVGIAVGAYLHGANRVGTNWMVKIGAASVASLIVFVVLLSSVVGSSQRSEYQAISLLLLGMSIALIFGGMRFARGGFPKPVRPPGIHWPRAIMWLLFVVNTGLIGAVFLSNL